ncbi:MAG: hypothetical protein HY787_17540 [Deltaproteobacteria bacterium]|nr:hypothetical protein [Deltaproteobacteria bacterium]
MSETGDTLQVLRDRQLSWGLRAIAIVGVFLLLVSLLRAVTVGWQPVMTLHIFLYLLLLLLAIISRRLPFSLRAGVVIFTCFIAGVAGLIMWGLVGMGVSALFVCCILTTIFFGNRAGTAMVTISVLVISVIGFLVVSGALTFNFDPLIYTTSYTSWAATLCAMAFVGGLIVLVLGTLCHEMENLIETLKSRNTELSKTIVCLESEMAERARIEEERGKLEEHLKHAKRMEDLGTLAAGVAHDLNNVLVGAVSYPDLILKQLPQGSPLRESLEQIKRSGVKAAAIVQDLLTLARRGVVSTQALDLNSVIGEYVTSLEFEKLKSFHPQVEVELNLGKDLPNISGSPLPSTSKVLWAKERLSPCISRQQRKKPIS